MDLDTGAQASYRNHNRGCRVVDDLSGHSDDVADGAERRRLGGNRHHGRRVASGRADRVDGRRKGDRYSLRGLNSAESCDIVGDSSGAH